MILYLLSKIIWLGSKPTPDMWNEKRRFGAFFFAYIGNYSNLNLILAKN